MKYLKDPFHKVSYSFRIEEPLFNDIKSYAKATGKKLPETFNDLLKKSIADITVRNTYLKGFREQLITIPDLKRITDILRVNGSVDVLNHAVKGNSYEVKRIPNNLDIWTVRNNEVKGFTSVNYPATEHEGIEIVLLPELIKPAYFKDADIVYNCLMYLHFKVTNNNIAIGSNYKTNISIDIINHDVVLELVKRINNFELLDKINTVETRVHEIIDHTLQDILEPRPDGSFYYKSHTYTDENLMLNDLCIDLTAKLEAVTDDINTGNVISNFDGSIERSIFPPVDNLEDDEDDVLTTLVNELSMIKSQINELQKENKLYREMIDKLTDDENN